jgi:hypothetical protein
MQDMKARPGGNWIPPSCQLRLVSRNNNVQRNSWGVPIASDFSGPMCPFLLHVGLALDLDLHARIYQPFHLNERGDR